MPWHPLGASNCSSDLAVRLEKLAIARRRVACARRGRCCGNWSMAPAPTLLAPFAIRSLILRRKKQLVQCRPPRRNTCSPDCSCCCWENAAERHDQMEIGCSSVDHGSSVATDHLYRAPTTPLLLVACQRLRRRTRQSRVDDVLATPFWSRYLRAARPIPNAYG